MKKRPFQKLTEFVTAVAALGAFAMLWLLLTQVVAVGIAVVVGVLVGAVKSLSAGVLAGIITYFVVMKVIWYLEIFDMIGIGGTGRKGKKPPN